jgi:hypothetical protein
MKRTKWYVYALLGRKQKDDARIAVRIAQAMLARDIVMTLDHVQIRRRFKAYREFMVNEARAFVALHGKQDTVYEWHYKDASGNSLLYRPMDMEM